MDRWKQKRTLEGMIKQLESQALRLRQLHAELFPEKETETESKEKSPTPPTKKGKNKEKESNDNNDIVRVASLNRESRKTLDGIFPPSVAQVQYVIDLLGFKTFTGVDFVTYYEARGWTIAKGVRMKSWIACLFGWNKNKGKDILAKSALEKAQKKHDPASFTASDAAASAARDEARQQREREQQERQTKSVSYEEYQRMKERGEIE